MKDDYQTLCIHRSNDFHGRGGAWSKIAVPGGVYTSCEVRLLRSVFAVTPSRGSTEAGSTFGSGVDLALHCK